MFSLITNSDFVTLRLKTINYSVSNGKGTVGSYITDVIANLSRISLQVDWYKQAPLTLGLLTND
jgi:hypothetical protein